LLRARAVRSRVWQLIWKLDPPEADRGHYDSGGGRLLRAQALDRLGARRGVLRAARGACFPRPAPAIYQRRQALMGILARPMTLSALCDAMFPFLAC